MRERHKYHHYSIVRRTNATQMLQNCNKIIKITFSLPKKYDESFVVFDYLDFYGANIQRYLNSTESS